MFFFRRGIFFDSYEVCYQTWYIVRSHLKSMSSYLISWISLVVSFDLLVKVSVPSRGQCLYTSNTMNKRIGYSTLKSNKYSWSMRKGSDPSSIDLQRHTYFWSRRSLIFTIPGNRYGTIQRLKTSWPSVDYYNFYISRVSLSRPKRLI